MKDIKDYYYIQILIDPEQDKLITENNLGVFNLGFNQVSEVKEVFFLEQITPYLKSLFKKYKNYQED